MPHFVINQHVLVNAMLLIIIALLTVLAQMGVPVGNLIATVAAITAAYNGFSHSVIGGH